MISQDLLKKYSLSGPRYTSYPAVPHWTHTPELGEWIDHVHDAFVKSNSQDGISLYIHLPFCESLCTYCGCNTRITVNHQVEKPYIESVLKEWDIYLRVFGDRPMIRELHLGGGTPTFFSPENLHYLLTEIRSKSIIPEDAIFSFEGHPANTTKEHLEVLFKNGFSRISLGIQDFDPKVQDIINRHQTPEQIEQICLSSRAIGYTSVNFDLIYGLPLQTVNSIIKSIEKTIALQPDRIAFYGYAHVPWIKPGQRKYTENDLPDPDTRLQMYYKGKEMLEEAGYFEIGMDHFALKDDELLIASRNQRLHRNFMGYTPYPTSLLIGLGVSSISDSNTAFHQNVKTVEAYNTSLSRGILPTMKGHVLSERDLLLKEIILDLMCRFSATIPNNLIATKELPLIYSEMIQDGLVSIDGNVISVEPKGRNLVRNICMMIDPYLTEQQIDKPLFSRTI